MNKSHFESIGKHLSIWTLSLALATGSAMPALASDGDVEALSNPNDSSIELASSDGEAADTQTASRPESVVYETVALKPSNPEPAESQEAPSEEAVEDVEEDVEDTELCTWQNEGRVWSTMRGGSRMSVSNAEAFGIDVSQWQGNIDWARVKSAGVQFAIVRCGYGSSATGEIDYQFLNNVQGCRENDIPMGIYLYAIASSPAESQAEANRVLELLHIAGITPDELSYPVYYDMESDSQKQCDSETIGIMAETFCNTLAEAGFTPGIYASHYWFSNILTDARFDNWTKWVASYPAIGERNASTSYPGQHEMWQCMSRGVIDGIEGRVDIDFDYRFVENRYDAIYNYDYYMVNNPDLQAEYADDRAGALLHFLETGMSEGRISSPSFYLHGYFNSNPDLRALFGLDFRQYYMHYQQYGLAEGRSLNETRTPIGLVKGFVGHNLSEIYDPYAYLINNPDLDQAFTRTIDGKTYLDDSGLFKHFLAYGSEEHRTSK